MKLLYEEVKEYIENQGYQLLSNEYNNSAIKLLIKCNKGHEYKATFGKFKSGRRCPHCANRIKITKEDVEKHLYTEGYTLVGDFVNGNVPIILECPNNHNWKVTYQKFKNGRRCPKCTGNERVYKGRVNWDTDLVEKELNKYSYKLLSRYKNAKEKLKVECDKGHIVEISWFHFTKGVRCKVCAFHSSSERQRIPVEEVDIFLNSIGYKRLSEYHNLRSKLKVECNNGHFTEMTFGNIKKGVRCKYCNYSKGEKRVIEHLEYLRLIYDREVRMEYEDTYIVFDFVIFDKNSKVQAFIEYDGIHHFKERSYFSESLEDINKRDERKNKYSNENSIPLLRIPYTKYNVLDDEIDEFLENNQITVIREGVNK